MMENPEEFEVDDENINITEEEYQKSYFITPCIIINFHVKFHFRSTLIQICVLENKRTWCSRRKFTSSMFIKCNVYSRRHCEKIIKILSKINKRHLYVRRILWYCFALYI